MATNCRSSSNNNSSSMVICSVSVVVTAAAALVVVLLAALDVCAFTVGVTSTQPLSSRSIHRHSDSLPSSTSLGVFGGAGFDPAPILDSAAVAAASASSFLISTIDSDIDSIPTNEFATVFAGGIVSFFFKIVWFWYWFGQNSSSSSFAGSCPY